MLHECYASTRSSSVSCGRRAGESLCHRSLEQGNMSNVKSVKKGVSEYRIDFGPGYRLYFGQEGQTTIILLGGGTKKRQRNDIANAQMLWTEYKSRKRG